MRVLNEPTHWRERRLLYLAERRRFLAEIRTALALVRTHGSRAERAEAEHYYRGLLGDGWENDRVLE